MEVDMNTTELAAMPDTSKLTEIIEPATKTIDSVETNLVPDEFVALEIYSVITETLEGSLTLDLLVNRLNEVSIKCSNDEDSSESGDGPQGDDDNKKSRRPSLFINSLADTLVQCEIETSVRNMEQRSKLLNLVKTLIKSNMLPLSVALERFEIDFNVQLGNISDKKQHLQSYNRLRTRLYYKQKKFNLLREESEGFSKIILALNKLNGSNQKQTLGTVIKIVGKYRVDPNRVLDLILEVFEFNSKFDYSIYIDFINSFYKNTHKILQLILLKLDYYKTAYKQEQVVTPQSFYRLMAILIHNELIDIDDIYPCLLPSDAKILEFHKCITDEAKMYSKKYAMAVVGEEKKTPPKTFRDDLSEEDIHFLEIDEQKMNLCAHLMDIGDWEQALNVARKLPEYYCFSNPRISTSACSFINYLIDPIYRECALTKSLNSKIRPLIVRSTGPKQITTASELSERIFPMLIALGPFLSADILLLTKIIRILRHILFSKQGNQAHGVDSPLYNKVLDVINDSILPSVSLSGKNCCLARELWSLIKNLEYQTRYKLYHNWRDEGSNAAILRHRGETLLCAKHHMKRLSKDTLRLTARRIGKLCYSNPVLTLNYILLQIQSYDNLITLVVDALRFIPPLAADALVYCIIESLCDPSKNKKSPDGMALASWLTSLATFSSNVILRYKVDFTGFLEYIAFQLKAGISLDLVLLTDLIQKMTGIETIQAITDDRIEALMGGDVLRTECAYFNQIKNTRKSSARLRDALIESRLATSLCTLIAQLGDSLCYKQDGTPLKLVGKLYDQCQETLVQYGAFLSMNLSIDDYINFMPPLDKLMIEYKLDPDSAFFLARPMIFHRIKSKFIEFKEAATKEVQIVEEGEAPEISHQTLVIKYVEAAKLVINSIAETLRPYLVEKYDMKNLNPKLFVIFWTLSMSDIEVPVNCYEREIQRLKNLLAELSKFSDDDPKRRKEKERYNNLIQKLKQEQANQLEHASFIRTYLESEKNSLFCVDKPNTEDVYLESRQFVQHCSYARSLLTATDAIYSARFFFLLHELEVKDFSTIICLDRLLCDLTYMISACTENEANHFGRFLCNILKTTTIWHSDGKIYNEFCETSPGSIIKREKGEHINYETFRDICYKWHYRLTRSFTISLESNNYIQIRNALIVMIKIIDYYPAIKHFGKKIGINIEDVRNNEKESRQDLYTLATAYAGKLDERKPYLMLESNFHTVDTPPNNSTSSNSKPSNSSSNSHRERHSSSSSRKKARHS